MTEKDAHIVRIIADLSKQITDLKAKNEKLNKSSIEDLNEFVSFNTEKPERSKCSVCGSENCYFGSHYKKGDEKV